jgi:hypothetical protein
MALFFQRFCRADIGLDHHFFNQPMRIKPRRNDHPVHGSVSIQQDLALRHVEFQRLAAVAPEAHNVIGMPQGSQDRIEQWGCFLIRVAIDGCLCLLVGQFGRTFHHDPVKDMARLAAFFGKSHPHGKGRAVHPFFQRAEIIGNPLW